MKKWTAASQQRAGGNEVTPFSLVFCLFGASSATFWFLRNDVLRDLRSLEASGIPMPVFLCAVSGSPNQFLVTGAASVCLHSTSSAIRRTLANG